MCEIKEMGHIDYVSDLAEVVKTLEAEKVDSSDFHYERNLMCKVFFAFGAHCTKKNNRYNLGAESLKNISFGAINNEGLRKSIRELVPNKEKMRLRVFPDFYLHESNRSDCINEEEQHLIAEVKTTLRLRKQDFFWDMLKLNLYGEQLQFKNLVFIIYGTKLKRIEKLIKEYVEKYYSDYISNIYFFVRPSNETRFKIYNWITD